MNQVNDFHDVGESGSEESGSEMQLSMTPQPFSPQYDQDAFLFTDQFDIQLSVAPKPNISTPSRLVKKNNEPSKTSIFNQVKNKKPILPQKRVQSRFNSEINMKESDFNGVPVMKQFQSPPTTKRTQKKIPKIAMKELKPLNLEKEREKFFQLNCDYDPQFEYANQQNLLFAQIQLYQDFQFLIKPHVKYLQTAQNIIKSCLAEFGTEENYSQIEGGPIMTQEEVEATFQKYIQELNVKELITFEFTQNTVAPTSVIHSNTDNSSRVYTYQNDLKVIIGLPITYRREKIQGVLDHEIGTHFIRKYNDKKQIWFKRREKFNLQPHIKNEEGLAVLNQTISIAIKPQSKPYLFMASLHYIAAIMSSQLSFSQLYHKLQDFMQNPEKRFRECLRVKRGILDTSTKGGMYKDQVYLIGALKVLKYRNKINFYSLHAGKITVKDCLRLSEKGLIQTDKIKMPLFLKDLNLYKKALDRIAEANHIQ